MKNSFIKSAITLVLIFCFARSFAQVSVNVNIGLQPDWGPVGYDYVEYYYIPQYEVYYYVPKREFVYLEGDHWIFASALPARFGRVDLYSPYKVVINEPKPYLHFKEHEVKYAKYKGGGERQEIIRDSKDPKYSESRKKEGNNSKSTSGHNEQKPAEHKSDVKPSSKSESSPSEHHNQKEKDDKKGKHPDDNQPH